jgi:hypothetical protein
MKKGGEKKTNERKRCILASLWSRERPKKGTRSGKTEERNKNMPM